MAYRLTQAKLLPPATVVGERIHDDFGTSEDWAALLGELHGLLQPL